MAERIDCAGLQVDAGLHALLENDILPGTAVSSDQFWSGLAAILTEMMPRNAELLEIRADMQSKLDNWHRERDCSRQRARHRYLQE